MKILFARVGHMRFYQGPQIGDERPIGGGSYNRTDIGHEAYNFKAIGGKMYAYFQPTVKKNGAPSTVALERIDPSALTPDHIEGVTVVFFSTHPKRREALVMGWFRNATVFREYQTPSSRVAQRRNGFNFNIVCDVAHAFPLPEKERFVLYETGGDTSKRGKPGQANAFYLLDERRRGKQLSKPESRWIARALDKIDAWNGESTKTNIQIDLVAMRNAFEDSQIAQSQGWRVDPKARKAVEDHAMDRAKLHYRMAGFVVDDVSSKESYDLNCVRGQANLRVEVKGTTTAGDFVFLTRNEIESAKKNRSELFVLHSISLTNGAAPIAKGGTQRILRAAWKPTSDSLVALAYQYRLPAEE